MTNYKVLIICLWFLLLPTIILGCNSSSDHDSNNLQVSSEKISAAQANGKLAIVTSTYPLYEFSQRIVGDFAEVFLLLPPGADAHDYEPSMRQVQAITEAEVFVYNGASFEMWIDKLLQAIEGDHQLTVINATEGIDLLTTEHACNHSWYGDLWYSFLGMFGRDHHHDHDDDHGEYDPHVWLNPLLAEQQAEIIYYQLLELLPQQAAELEDNFAQLSADLQALDELFYEQLQEVNQGTFVVSHAGYAYLAERYGLTQNSVAGVHPGVEPSNRELRAIIDYMQEQEERYIFFETTVSNKTAQVIADEVGASILQLHPIANLTAADIEAGEDYFTLMQRNLEQLLIALK